MKHYTTAILTGDNSLKELFAKSWGKKGTSTDIALHTLAKPDIMTSVIPLRYPEKPIPLVLATHMADVAVLPISSNGITPPVAEAAILADVLNMNGVRAVISEGAQAFESFHSQFEKFFKDSSLLTWPKQTIEPSDLNNIRDSLLQVLPPATSSEAPAIIEVDHAFSVQGVGAVILGTVIQGTISKGDKIVAYPGSHQGNVRSIQVNDVEVRAAGPRTHVGLAIRGILPKHLERGTVLATTDGTVSEKETLSGTFQLSPVISSLSSGLKVHIVAGLSDTPAKLILNSRDGNSADIELELSKPIPFHSNQKVTILDLNAKQRIIGSMIIS